MASELDNKLFIEQFKAAIKNEQFKLYILPKFNAKNHFIYGGEALIRWDHPFHGLLAPKDFLPQCYKLKLMNQIDMYMLEHACRYIKEFCDHQKPIHLSVKISKETLLDIDQLKYINEIVKKSNSEKEYLDLEIEEEVIKDDIYKASEAIEFLKNEGFHIILDDFSYGSSSISVLSQFDVDYLKIDLKYYSFSSKTNKGEIVLSSLIRTLNWLNIRVVAECVETALQDKFSKDSGCELTQGFYYSQPITLDQFKENYNDQIGQDGQLQDYQSSKSIHILIIDNSKQECELLKTYLEDDYIVHTIHNGEDAIVYLADLNHSVDVILLDYSLPQMSGMDFLQFAKSDVRINQTPKIMMTSSDHITDQKEAFEAGAYDYLIKPLMPELVKIRIKHALEVSNQLNMYEEEKESFQELSEKDKATNLYNKETFIHYTEDYLLNNPQTNNALIIIDIDDFKTINDTYGHLIGDDVIKFIANSLLSHFRKDDYVGRFGGDEFIVFIENMSNKESIAEKVGDFLDVIRNNSLSELEFNVSISIGVGYSEYYESFDSLFKKADSALYEVKNSVKGCYLEYGDDF